MADRLVLHIGLPKTGTTFAQNHVFPLLDSSVVSFLRPIELAKFARRFAFTEARELSDNLLRVAEETSGTLFLSWEGIAGPPHDWERRAEILASVLPSDTEIVISLRDPWEWIWSSYTQVLKSGYPVKFEHFAFSHEDFVQLVAPVLPPASNSALCVECVNYRSLVSFYSSRFPLTRALTSTQLCNPNHIARLLGASIRTSGQLPTGLPTRMNSGYGEKAASIFVNLAGRLQRFGLTLFPDSPDDIGALRPTIESSGVEGLNPQLRLRHSRRFDFLLRALDRVWRSGRPEAPRWIDSLEPILDSRVFLSELTEAGGRE